MGKRSDFKRRPRDFYPTPAKAVFPLLSHLPAGATFCEPCAGDGALIDHLEAAGHLCSAAFDIEPLTLRATVCDLTTATVSDFGGADFVITNPPWERTILHQVIDRLIVIGQPSWLLFDAAWMFTKQADRFLEYVHCVVVVGRVMWIPDSGTAGKDDCCWYFFKPERNKNRISFFGKK